MPRLFSKLKKHDSPKSELAAAHGPTGHIVDAFPLPPVSPPQPRSPSFSGDPQITDAGPSRQSTQKRDKRRSHKSMNASDIPARSTSLHAGLGVSPVDTRSIISSRETSPEELRTRKTSGDHVRRSNSVGSAADKLARLSVAGTAGLEAQRAALVDEIATGVRARKEEQPEISEAGRGVFKAAGIEHVLDLKGTVEMHTRWTRPVVEETIVTKEHTEVTTVTEKEVHIHHIFPKIQPLFDPTPVTLEPRHRIFSPADGEWHEVVGDAAAIAILGEDAFYNGIREVRYHRAPALPGFESSEPGGDGAGKSRIIEREGTEGKMGRWHALGRTETVGTPGETVGQGWMMEEDLVGPAQRTFGVAI